MKLIVGSVVHTWICTTIAEGDVWNVCTCDGGVDVGMFFIFSYDPDQFTNSIKVVVPPWGIYKRNRIEWVVVEEKKRAESAVSHY